MGSGVPAGAVTVNFDPGPKDAEATRNCADLWPFTATEVRNLMAYDGKLFAATGVWMDQTSPHVGPSIMVLKSGNDTFEIEQQFTVNDTAICLLHVAHFDKPKGYTVPIASTWHGQGFVDLHYRDYHNGSWHFAQQVAWSQSADSKPCQARSAFNYTDPETGMSMLFLGVSPDGIYSIKHDPGARAGLAQAILEWRSDRPQDRVMTFGVVRGKLYAAVYDRLFERQNGSRASWTLVHEDPNMGESESGWRGLTTVAGQYSNNGYFFVGREGEHGAVLKLVPKQGGGFTQTVDYDMPARLSEAWTKLYGGTVGAGYSIAGYNDMTWFQPRGPQGHWALFCGIESFIGQSPPSMPILEMNNFKLHAIGAYLLWNYENDGRWRLNHLPAVTSQPMVSCRTGIVNPFGGTRFYIAGLDCNYEPSHNSGWVVSLDMARMLDGAVA